MNKCRKDKVLAKNRVNNIVPNIYHLKEFEDTKGTDRNCEVRTQARPWPENEIKDIKQFTCTYEIFVSCVLHHIRLFSIEHTTLH